MSWRYSEEDGGDEWSNNDDNETDEWSEEEVSHIQLYLYVTGSGLLYVMVHAKNHAFMHIALKNFELKPSLPIRTLERLLQQI